MTVVAELVAALENLRFFDHSSLSIRVGDMVDVPGLFARSTRVKPKSQPEGLDPRASLYFSRKETYATSQIWGLRVYRT